MYWQESESQPAQSVPDDVVDVGFRIDSRLLPADHAWVLAQELKARLPWLETDDVAGVHSIHGGASGNGWTRPADDGAELLNLPARARLYLRLRREHVEAAQALIGQTLNISGYGLAISSASVRPLSPLGTLGARYVLGNEREDETQFLRQVDAQLQAIGIRAHKLLCGIPHHINTADGRLFARSLMVADLDLRDSVNLQQRGLGDGRMLGCGLFVPHKGIGAIREADTQ